MEKELDFQVLFQNNEKSYFKKKQVFSTESKEHS
jgi:hypothetical protein